MGAFKFSQTPEPVLAAIYDVDDAERELARFRAPLSIEDQGDRESVLAIHAKASKTLARIPARLGSHLRSLA
ncbi:hypothetical protein ACFV90_36990 [Streptomyces sp. NPDC059904]|uniref:hypothetical protein n=1 Tax=Streptomyces sp. NPDC059904 TaxID=3346996 RepID=UPI0036545C1A